eukprot:GDKI01040778.1.p1 GENE.GDKI01040778.1~~GDKI01040778.1.p1  ORF type:complete len:449 (-),score=161.32 GDKI01040778.1:365-1633(-)
MSYVSLFGPKLTGKNGEVDTATALKDKIVGIYFSAHWCPPCRGFTPKLVESYKDMVAAGKNFEVVFVSSDKDQGSFDEYYGEMPWLALPFADRDRKNELSKKFKVSGIPSFVIVDENGTITTQGRAQIAQDPKGEKFPWRPLPLDQLLGDKFFKNDGTEVTMAQLKGKHIGLYFSAHWCPPCRGFTPKFADVYKKLQAKNTPFEVIFLSSDRDEAAFKEYHSEMPWLAVPFADRDRKNALSQHFEVQGIPSLVILDHNLKVVNADCVGRVRGDEEGAEFPWAPRLVNPLDPTQGDLDALNEAPCVIAICDKSDKAAQDKIHKQLEEVAKEYRAKAEAKGDDQEYFFFVARGGSDPAEGILQQIRGLSKLDGNRSEPQLIILDASKDSVYVEEGKGEIDAQAVRAFIAKQQSGQATKRKLDEE